MEVLCNNIWKKRIVSILLCFCMLITNIQIPAFAYADESEAVQYSDNASVDEGVQISTEEMTEEWITEVVAEEEECISEETECETEEIIIGEIESEECAAESGIETDIEIETDTEVEIETVKNVMDALPEVSELDGLDEEKKEQVYLVAQYAWDAYEALTEEEKAELR